MRKSQLLALSPSSRKGSISSMRFLSSSPIEMNVSCPVLVPSPDAPVNVPVERIGRALPDLSLASAA